MATADLETSGLTVNHKKGKKEGVRVWELSLPWGSLNMKQIYIAQNKYLFSAEKLEILFKVKKFKILQSKSWSFRQIFSFSFLNSFFFSIGGCFLLLLLLLVCLFALKEVKQK